MIYPAHSDAQDVRTPASVSSESGSMIPDALERYLGAGRVSRKWVDKVTSAGTTALKINRAASQAPGKFARVKLVFLTLRGFMEENMRASMVHTISRSVPVAMIGAWVAVGAPVSAHANVITD